MQVSGLSIVFMGLSAIIAFGIPIILFVIFHKKYNAPFLPIIVGIVGFVIFALGLERTIHAIVLGRFALREKPFIYVLYGILMAGIFEETARYISFNILKKKYNTIGTGISYGIGHGGIEAILLVGIAMVNNTVISVLVNTGSVETITGNLQGALLEQANMQIANLIAIPPYQFLVGGIERIFAMSTQISLSLIVFHAVFCKDKWWLYPMAIIIHAIVDIPAVLMQVGVIKSILLVEFLVCICSIALIILAIRITKKIEKEKHNIKDGYCA
jgi:uncharacterized membrane protein YhfC